MQMTEELMPRFLMIHRQEYSPICLFVRTLCPPCVLTLINRCVGEVSRTYHDSDNDGRQGGDEPMVRDPITLHFMPIVPHREP
jgi:hypothetical protein